MIIQDSQALTERALHLGEFNGVKMALVSLTPQPNPVQAVLSIHFFNDHGLVQLLDDIAGDPEALTDAFPITGGQRIIGGTMTGQVRTVEAAVNDEDARILELTVEPVGDYSTYVLEINGPLMDPVFSEVEFKFRPGCFNNCAPDWKAPTQADQPPAIDYLAKDHASFKHTLISAMMDRVPGWAPTSEADLDQTLIGLFSAAADELSDYQDRVMNEAYLGTARKRVSLARHARLMDYHVHQGNQASTQLMMSLKDGEAAALSAFAVSVLNQPQTTFLYKNAQPSKLGVDGAFGADLDAEFLSNELRNILINNGLNLSINLSVSVREPDRRWQILDNDQHQILYLKRENGEIQVFEPHLHHFLNNLALYTWSGTQPALARNAVRADLKVPDGSESNALLLRNLLRSPQIRYLVIEEHLNPATGRQPGRNPEKRQLLTLAPGNRAAGVRFDPITQQWLVRVQWLEKLEKAYCFEVNSGFGMVEGVSLFHGNLIPIFHGTPVRFIFRPEDQPLKAALYAGDPEEVHYQRTEDGVVRCTLPAPHLAWQNTEPGGETPPQSTMYLEVETQQGRDPWNEVISLIHSDNGSETGDHFVVETDEAGRSLVRFGNEVQGRRLPQNAVVHISCQLGRGEDGNLGADALTQFSIKDHPEINRVRNPFDITSGRQPETRSSIIRRAPQAWKHRQLRAVTLKDYELRAQALPEVARASASYAWTGSWRTVRIAIDPLGGGDLTGDQKKQLAEHLEAVRLIGEDLEIRPPSYIALDIHVNVCIHPQYWPQDMAIVLEQAFSNGFTFDMRQAFFHPDRWTFGQSLHKSQIHGVITALEGVAHVIDITIKRRDHGRNLMGDIVRVRPGEIIRVDNDPSHLEGGSIRFSLKGGRQ